MTYIYDQEVQPAPVVGKVFLEAIRNPLEEHLQHKDVGEHLVGRLQHHFHKPPLLNVYVLEGLQEA